MDDKIDVLWSVKERMEAAISCCRQAITALEDGREEETITQVCNIEEKINYTKRILSQRSQKLCEHSNYAVIYENLSGSIAHFTHFWGEGDKERALIVLKFEMMALVRDLKEDFYFWNFIYPDDRKMKNYYTDEYARNYRNEYVANGYKHEVSIIVVGYNKFEYTKQCVEYLFEKTDLEGLDCELITINNGSSDETESFFESLPHTKKINFKRNAMSSMGPCIQNAAEGRYLVLLPNDVIVTDHWLQNLLTCIKSDDTIISVVPVTNYMSNLQTIEVNYKTIPEMQEFAGEYNKSDPLKWEDRARLLPTLWLISLDKLNKIGFGDRYFYFGEFGDDDLSLRSRRAGYRQILCRDTFVHHFGSVTSREAQRKHNSLGISRELFRKKHGLDAWSHDAFHNPLMIRYLDFNKTGKVNILGIDSGFGNTPLKIKSIFREKGNMEARVYNFTTDSRFAPDLNSPVSDFFQLGAKTMEIKNAFKGIKFDYVYINENAERYDNFFCLLEIIAGRIRKGGQLIFNGINNYSVDTVFNIFTGGQVNEDCLIRSYDMQKIQEKLSEQFKDLKCIYQNDLNSSTVDKYIPKEKKEIFLNSCFELLGINASREFRNILNCNLYTMIAKKN